MKKKLLLLFASFATLTFVGCVAPRTASVKIDSYPENRSFSIYDENNNFVRAGTTPDIITLPIVKSEYTVYFDGHGTEAFIYVPHQHGHRFYTSTYHPEHKVYTHHRDGIYLTRNSFAIDYKATSTSTEALWLVPTNSEVELSLFARQSRARSRGEPVEGMSGRGADVSAAERSRQKMQLASQPTPSGATIPSTRAELRENVLDAVRRADRSGFDHYIRLMLGTYPEPLHASIFSVRDQVYEAYGWM